MRSSPSKPMSSGMKFFYLRIFPLIFVLTGGITIFLGIRELIKADASVNWPSSPGKITESSIKRHQNKESITYHASILYDFTLDGTTYTGNRIAYGDYGSSNPSHARNIIDRYPKARNVIVYYMPGNPKECLLEPGLKGQSWFLPGSGLVFLTAGVLLTIFLPKTLKNNKIKEQQNEICY